MKKITLFLAGIVFSANSYCDAPPWLWAGRAGSAGFDQSKGIAIDRTSGDVYTFGRYQGTVDFDPGPGVFNLTAGTYGDGSFILKLDAQGGFVFAKSLNGGMSSGILGYGMAADNTGAVYLTGVFFFTIDFDPGPGTFNMTAPNTGNVFICKLDKQGNFVWAKSIGDSGHTWGMNIAVDATGSEVYATGWFDAVVDFDPGTGTYNITPSGSHDAFLVKLNGGSGDFIWARALSGTDAEEGSAITIDDASNHDVVLTGYFQGTTDFDPGASTFQLTSGGAQDIYICKFDSSGNFIGAASFSGLSSDFSRSICFDLTGSGDIFIAGAFSGTTDFDPGPGVYNLTPSSGGSAFICKLNPAFSLLLVKAISYSGATSMVVSSDASQDIYLAGGFHSTADFDPGPGTHSVTSSGSNDAFVCKLDSSGNFIWVATGKGSSSEAASAMDLGLDGNIFVTGNFISPASYFGQDTLINLDTLFDIDAYDIFIAKLDTTMTGIFEATPSLFGFTISPVPARDEIVIQHENLISLEIEIFNVMGEKIPTSTGDFNNRTAIDITSLRSGIYFVRLRTREGTACGKFVKE